VVKSESLQVKVILNYNFTGVTLDHYLLISLFSLVLEGDQSLVIGEKGGVHLIIKI
jgi:hypothetical protein